MLKEYILNKEHHKFRKEISLSIDKSLSARERMIYRFEKLCEAETPVILPDEQICFIRTVKNLPDIFDENEWKDIKEKYYIHELGFYSNLSPDFEGLIRDGLLKRAESADECGKRAVKAILSLTERYREEAIKCGREDIAETLKQVPAHGARNFREALQSMRIIHYALWLEGSYHNTVGRFDQYMYPYFKADMDKGVYTEESALSLLEDFFISFNKDSDLYPGVQQGDNGQSMVLGGIDKDGNEAFNLLSELCLKASKNLLMIDPKINLRVSKNTPLKVFELGSELTKAGLGFPQYLNDDVCIKGLCEMGYDLEDARDYAVAACWELIIPKVGFDVANIKALSFPKVVNISFRSALKNCDNFEEFKEFVRRVINMECDMLCCSMKPLRFVPAAFTELCMNEKKYVNYGIHGTGVANAADSLYAIKKYYFDEKKISLNDYQEAVNSDFEKHPELLPILRYETPKMGMDIDEVDEMATFLLDCFADSLKGRKNTEGGIFRAGTGSAMYYLWHANELGASPDGRRKGEPFGANFSPSIFAKIDGPLSVVKSFTKQNLIKTLNGGPLTMEFHHSMFTDPDCITKVAMLVREFIRRGGHELQLNAVNLEKLKDAQNHPENHRQLVVRIWGWSAYFVELDKEYQDHVMKRQEYSV